MNLNHNLKYILAVFISLNSFSLLAQNPVPGNFTIAMNAMLCYDKDDYPTAQNATDQLLIDHLGYAFCSLICPADPLKSCKAKLMNTTTVLLDNGISWCYSGEALFRWKCAPQVYGEIPVDLAGPLEPGNGIPGGGGVSDPNRSYKYGEAQFFPNPSNGQLNLSLHNAHAESDLGLVIHDGLGKRVYSNTWTALPVGQINLSLDLHLAPGVYYGSIMIDQQWTESKPLIMQ